jgi:hypothetical protein
MRRNKGGEREKAMKNFRNEVRKNGLRLVLFILVELSVVTGTRQNYLSKTHQPHQCWSDLIT